MRLRRRESAAALVVAALAFGAGACGDGGDTGGDGESGADPVGQDLAGSVASLAECRDWTEATEDEKLATIADIRGQVNRSDTTVTAPPLSDEEAMQVFDGACAESYAASFRLYVLYARAAGFAPLTRDAPAEQP